MGEERREGERRGGRGEERREGRGEEGGGRKRREGRGGREEEGGERREGEEEGGGGERRGGRGEGAGRGGRERREIRLHHDIIGYLTMTSPELVAPDTLFPPPPLVVVVEQCEGGACEITMLLGVCLDRGEWEAPIMVDSWCMGESSGVWLLLWTSISLAVAMFGSVSSRPLDGSPSPMMIEYTLVIASDANLVLLPWIPDNMSSGPPLGRLSFALKALSWSMTRPVL